MDLIDFWKLADQMGYIVCEDEMGIYLETQIVRKISKKYFLVQRFQLCIKALDHDAKNFR